MRRVRTPLILLLCVPLAFTGCHSSEMHDVRSLTFDIANEEPEGLYCIELQDEECAQIEEDIVVDVMGHTCGLDRAYLRNAIISFTHRGRPIANGNSPEAHNHPGLNVWLIRREGHELWYYIGTQEQYAALDLSRNLRVGGKTVQF